MSTDDDHPGPIRDRCTTPDGVGIAVYDFGGEGTDLLLVHATGFCAEVLLPMARALSDRYRCWGLDLRAHGRSDRPSDGEFAWSGFALDVLAAVDHLGLEQPSAFGHSCGGASILLAEASRPGTFRSLYCFEPVVVPDGLLAFATGENPLSAGARRRRATFPSAEDAFVNFSSKPPFDDCDPAVLRLYVEAGFEPVPSGDGGDGQAIRLRCRREDEAEIFASAASSGTFGRLPEVRCPVTLACGALTDAFGPTIMEADAARLPRSTVEVLPGIGHFGPLERPEVVAESVRRALGTNDVASSS